MSDKRELHRIVDRANRMLKQSKTLRKMADELLQESNDLRVSAKRLRPKKPRRKLR